MWVVRDGVGCTQPFNLTKAERLQLINDVPENLVHLYMVSVALPPSLPHLGPFTCDREPHTVQRARRE